MIFTVEIQARYGKFNELYQTLQALLLTMRRAGGCLGCRASNDPENGRLHILSSEWDRTESFRAYIRSGSGSALIGAIDLLGESSRIRVGVDAEWESVEVIKCMRKE